MRSFFREVLRTFAALCVSAAAIAVTGCVQMPTETSKGVDLRPRISFSVEKASALSARVNVDGEDSGAVSDYLDGKSSLRLLPGNHRIQVIEAGVLLIDEKAYLGDGVSRSFLLR